MVEIKETETRQQCRKKTLQTSFEISVKEYLEGGLKCHWLKVFFFSNIKWYGWILPVRFHMQCFIDFQIHSNTIETFSCVFSKY